MRSAFLFLTAISCGCAGTWDTVTSRKFRQNPFSAVFKTGDPLTIMKTSAEGDERADAMRRLKEPIRHGGTSSDQDEAMQLLAAAATNDPSPVVRIAAIDALARFQDERAIASLTAAYYSGDGIPPGIPKPKPIRSVNSEDPAALAARFSLRGPVGYPEEVASAIRSRAIQALAGSGKPEAFTVIATAAKGGGEMPIDRDTQLAAVRGLAKMRSKESLPVLLEVMKTESGKDPALTARARESLASLTGKDLGPDTQAWQAMNPQATEIVPESNGILQVGAWLK